MSIDPPPGYMVLAGESTAADDVRHVFMNYTQEDRLFMEDPWRTKTLGLAGPPAAPAPTVTQRVVGAVAAIGDTIRGH